MDKSFFKYFGYQKVLGKKFNEIDKELAMLIQVVNPQV